MKKIFVLMTALVATTAITHAQNTTFGIKAGIINSSLHLHAEDGDTKFDIDGAKIGAIVGGVADISFSEKFSIQPNLLFVYKPGSLLFLGEGDVTTTSIDVPINFLYHNAGFFAGAGPNFSYGLSSKFKPFDNTDDDIDLYKKQGTDDAPFKRFEIGANITMGYKFASGLTLSTQYTHGFSNIANEDLSSEAKFSTRQFGLSIGYMFGGSAAAKKK
jgi:hypothetical protein